MNATQNSHWSALVFTPKGLHPKARGRAAHPGESTNLKMTATPKGSDHANASVIRPLRGRVVGRPIQPGVRCATPGFEIQPLRGKTGRRSEALGVIAFFLLCAGCAPAPAVSPQPPANASGSPVIGSPQKMSLKRVVEQPGRVEALAQTPLHAKVAGFVAAWHKDIGDAVEAGTPLAEIAVPELDQELAQKQAVVAQATAEVKQAKALLEAAGANTR